MIRNIFTLALVMLTLAFATTALADYERIADNTVPAYQDSGLTNRTGNERVDRGDRVTVHQETDRAYEVTYPTSRGSKRRWVPKNIFNQSNSNTVTLADGWYRIQPMHDLGRSADALGPQIGNGNNVHMWTNVDALQQKFYLQNRGNGYFSLRSAYGNQLYVTVDGNGNGANLYTSSWNGSDSQLFRLVNAGNNSYHVFAKVGNNLNFDCAGAGKSDGNNVQLWTSENNPWHCWRFTKVTITDNYIWPIKNPANPDNYTINTLYYYSGGSPHSVWYNIGNGGEFNSLDIRAAIGKEIVAVADGKVVACATSKKGAKYVKINHGSTESLYAHLSRNDVVRVGQTVSQGQVIGISGDTGTPGSPHLHFEFSSVNAFEYYRDRYPLKYRASIRQAYNKVLMLSSVNANDKRKFEDAVSWINSHGGFLTY